MRIVSGEHRGRRLVAPPGRETRPTADRARQALFDVLSHAEWAPDLAEARVLDLFAGSGALGIEALSRGAREAVFVETSREAAETIRRNLESLGIEGRGRILRLDAARLAANPGSPFDLAFLDPPYDAGALEPALAGLLSGGWLRPGGVAVAEHAAGRPLAAEGFERLLERRWGAAEVAFLRPAVEPAR